MLHLVTHGDPSSLPPLLIVHGLFGSARNWGAVQRRLADRGQVVAVDMRNHGESFHAGTQSYADMAGDLAEVITAIGAPADVMGHSMGGKAAMMLALEHPDLVNRLLVADIAPVAYGHSLVHLIHAMRGLDLTGLDTRTEADRRLSQTIDAPGLRAFLLQSLDLKSDPVRWRLNLDVLEAEMAGITGWPDTAAGQYDGPTLFLSGTDSDYVLPEHRETIRGFFPKARFARLPGAGHWLHADKPREFEAVLRSFFA
ncbi:MAG: alpha/beta fold hydrolase [Rhodobacteraceae bacterium]|nr:alpha/beta fold hydrolase [Paracoccaceae bacterium]